GPTMTVEPSCPIRSLAHVNTARTWAVCVTHHRLEQVGLWDGHVDRHVDPASPQSSSTARTRCPRGRGRTGRSSRQTKAALLGVLGLPPAQLGAAAAGTRRAPRFGATWAI